MSKITGAANISIGATVAAGSAHFAITSCAVSAGTGCIAGGAIGILGVKAGYDQTRQGGRQLFDTYQSDFGRRVVHSLGRPIEYDAPLVSDAKNLALWGLESLITRKIGQAISIHNTNQSLRLNQGQNQLEVINPTANSRRDISSVDGEMFSNRNTDFSTNKIGDVIHDGAQGKHILGHNNYIPGKSILNANIDPKELLDGIHNGSYPIISRNNRNKPVVDFGKPIGIDNSTGLSTNFGTVHTSNKGVHIVPYNPNLIIKVE